ncbi:MAG: hypothetical protein R8M45_10460, partial [Ghiorsea sp.]
LFHNDYVNMTYPSVAGDYVVYSQRASHRYQVVQLNTTDLTIPAKDVIPMFSKDVVRNGIALANGDIAYVSNRLTGLTPWIKQPHAQAILAPAIFKKGMQPNHLNSNASGSLWVFDSSLDNTRQLRIADQFNDGHLHHQLLGQAWRMYHEKFWAYRSGYSATATGTTNKFWKPNLFLLSIDSQQVTMFNDGFDADISDDGKKIVFVRENEGNYDLWLQNIDGSAAKRLTTNKYADLEPSFSADGKKIAFVSNRDALGDVTQTFIYTLEIATGKIQAVTSGMQVIDGGPAWLDDNTIIFHSNRDFKSPQAETVERWSLWTVNIKP